MPRQGLYHVGGRSNSRHHGHVSPPRHGSPPWHRSSHRSGCGHPGHYASSVSTCNRCWASSSPMNVYRYTSLDMDDTQEGRDGGRQMMFSQPDLRTVLTVKNVDLKISANGTAHHTSSYDIAAPCHDQPKLVVRRGQPFKIHVDFSRPYDTNTDDLRLVFEAGDRPLTSKGTYVDFILSDKDEPKEWGAKIIKREGNSVMINVFTPPTCYVGTWDLRLDVVKKDNTEVQIYRYEHKDPIYILFNPWCKDDAVYMSDDKLLKEYVLNETGKIFSGSKNNITSKPWNFGQFDSCVLDCVMYLLDVSELDWAVRGNPISVVRKISAMVNSQDDSGVLAGKWIGGYEGGRSPLSWTGSVAILEEYWRTKRPVKYGQCWVFSGVTTTICRALGIPARSVTNFASAHDTDGSITIDVHFNPDGDVDKELSRDSVWNFHVWNEVWMARPDLPAGYGGWQAIDATPQETSDGVHCCGPTSVRAIQKGEIYLPYDGSFVFAEVNADRFHWKPGQCGKLECVQCDEKVVGKFISTKAPNSTQREDVTTHYKYAEGSSEERAAVLKANQLGSCRRDIYKATTETDVEFKVEQDSENSWLGANFVVGLRMKNKSKAQRTVSGMIAVRSMFYTGVLADELVTEPFQAVLEPSSDSVYELTVPQDDYENKLKDCCMLDVSIWANVKETGQSFIHKGVYRLRKPHLAAKAPAVVTSGMEFLVHVSFTNPMKTTLYNCYVVVDGLSQEYKFPQRNVQPGETFKAGLPITPRKVGQRELIIIFNSSQLEDINTAVPIHVKA